MGIAAREWNFGDGTISTEACPPHRYEADGQYVVTLRVTTPDGRSDTATRLVRVTTHDVSIAGAEVPGSRSRRIVEIAVRVASARYPEMVQVELLRSAGGGTFERVELLTQPVPAQAEAEFAFRYAVTEGDAAAGSIAFGRSPRSSARPIPRPPTTASPRRRRSSADFPRGDRPAASTPRGGPASTASGRPWP